MSMKKCPICSKKFENNNKLASHIEKIHPEAIPEGWSAHRYLYSLRHDGKTYSNCMVCGTKTEWNDATNKPMKICSNPNCRKILRQNALNNLKKAGKENLLNDPEFQKKMQAGRKISGKYRWTDGGETQYMGSYEKDFLQFLDVFFNFPSNDIIAPAPFTFTYEIPKDSEIYDGKTHFYIPDVYITSINVLVEIKPGGSNPNKHPNMVNIDKVKEKLKDEVMKKQKQYNYIKITDKNYGPFVQFLLMMKENDLIGKPNVAPIIMINEQIELISKNLNNKITDKKVLVVYEYNSSITNLKLCNIDEVNSHPDNIIYDSYKIYLMNENLDKDISPDMIYQNLGKYSKNSKCITSKIYSKLETNILSELLDSDYLNNNINTYCNDIIESLSEITYMKESKYEVNPLLLKNKILSNSKIKSNNELSRLIEESYGLNNLNRINAIEFLIYDKYSHLLDESLIGDIDDYFTELSVINYGR